MKKRLAAFLIIFILASCAAKEVNKVPEEFNAFRIQDTPAFIILNQSYDMEVVKSDILFCTEVSLGSKALIASGRVIKEVGAAVGIGGLLLAADLAITGGLFTSLAVLPIGLASMMGWTLYKSADALSELGSFKGLETCLESKGYDVVFYIESKK